MSELRAQLREWRQALDRAWPWWPRGLGAAVIVAGLLLPFFFSQSSAFINTEILALAYVVFALGLNVVVGFAGLLDLGYVAFFALGAYTLGWFASDFFFKADLHVGVNHIASTIPGSTSTFY